MNNYPCNRNNYLRSRTIHVEAEVEIPGCREVSYATCWLPATEQQLKDFMQRARIHPKMQDLTYHILSCPPVQEIAEMRMDTFTLGELNFLAKRLAVLPEPEISAMNALLQDDGVISHDQMELVSLRNLINMTYGVEDLPVVADIFSLRDLGEYVIENELHPDIENIPEDCRYLLDRERIGELQRDCDDGVIIDGMYVATQDFTMPDVYNGVDLPETDEDKKAVFRLLISQAPYASADETRDSAEWISLPISPKEADRIAGLHGEGHIEDCMLYDMESAIPSLNLDTYNDMMDFRFLNELAGWYLAMSQREQIKYKAVLEAEPELNAERALQLAKELPAYELSYFSLSPKEFFRDYVSHFTDNRFDSRWLDEISEPEAAAELLRKLGATQTNYGVVSAYGGQLFTPISRFEDQTQDTAPDQSESNEEPNEGMEMRM